MTRLRLVPVFALLTAAACFSPNRVTVPGDTDTGSSSVGLGSDGGVTQGSSDGVSSAGVTGADGGTACTDDGQCDDGDPCTDDGCDGGSCVHAPRVGDPACTCSGAGDCMQLPPDDDCRARSCTDGVCGSALTDEGTPVNASQQTAEDCKQVVCDGAGGIQVVSDDGDVPDDGLECTVDACNDGTPSNAPAAQGTACAAGQCNAVGQCTGCSTAADCGGQDSFCQQATCADGICGVAHIDDQTPLPDGDQTSADCQRRVCDGRGNVATIAADNDLPEDDGNPCTDETCTDGIIGHPPLPAQTACNGNGVCDGDGNCVECNLDAQCPAAGACTVGVCVDHECTVGNANAGTSCNDGLFCTANDACNGSGSCVGSGSPCPDADGDSNCAESCNEGTDTCNANDPNGSACNDGLFCTGVDHCNGSGSCVGAGNPCPGADGDSDCSEMCNEATDACNGNDPGGSDCGSCHSCNGSGSCVGECGVGEKCCAADDFCIPTNASCP